MKTFVLYFMATVCLALAHGDQEKLSKESEPPKKASRFYYDGRYYEISSLALNWFAAGHACKEQGMQLVSIESNEENLAILQAISGESDSFWTSGTDLAEERYFVWDATGKSVDTYTYWANGEPENGLLNSEHCVQMYAKAYHHWHDRQCEDVERYICEQVFPCK